MADPSFSKLAPVYRSRWDGARLTRAADAERFIGIILKNRPRYVAVEKATGVPWFWVAAIHMRESSCNFAGVLHNGEHIIGTGRKTTLVPKGRGPFNTWSEAAIDAIRSHGLHRISDWPIERLLYEAERFNGWGYLRRGPSPYVWAGTNWYRAGKYIADGVYSATHVDTQLGVAIIWKLLEQRGIQISRAPSPEPPPPPPDIEPEQENESPAAIDPESKPAVQSKTIWASIGGILATIGGALTDWRVAAVIVVFIFLLIIADRYLKLDIRGWFR